MSRSLDNRDSKQLARLAELEDAHAAVGGTKPGRRYSTTQINHASVVAIAAEFQAFCRNLHSEARIRRGSSVIEVRIIEDRGQPRCSRLPRPRRQPGRCRSQGRFYVRVACLAVRALTRQSLRTSRNGRLTPANIAGFLELFCARICNLTPAEEGGTLAPQPGTLVVVHAYSLESGG